MNVRKIIDDDIAELIEFNRQHFPDKNIEDYIPYRCQNHPYLQKSVKESIIAFDDESKIVGQILLVPLKFKYETNILSGVWGMDFIVDEKARTSQAGIVLVMKSLENENLFGLGLSSVSLKLHLALKVKIIGHVSRFFRIDNYFRAFYQYILNKQKDPLSFKFPKKLGSNESTFLRVENPEEIINRDGFYNDNILEFSRDYEFIKWRFFYGKEKYFVYKNKNGLSYFVVRPIIWKKMNCLILVDYRMQINNNKMFDSILKAVTNLSCQLKMAATITGCSLPSLYKNLKENGFIKFGNELNVVSNSKISERILNSEDDKIFVTFADSDSDFNYGNSKT